MIDVGYFVGTNIYVFFYEDGSTEQWWSLTKNSRQVKNKFKGENNRDHWN
jgi:hypothetical protein